MWVAFRLKQLSIPVNISAVQSNFQRLNVTCTGLRRRILLLQSQWYSLRVTDVLKCTHDDIISTQKYDICLLIYKDVREPASSFCTLTQDGTRSPAWSPIGYFGKLFIYACACAQLHPSGKKRKQKQTCTGNVNINISRCDKSCTKWKIWRNLRKTN